MKYPSIPNTKPLALMVAAAFPIIANAAPIASANGYYNIQADPFEANIVAKSGSFTQTPTTSAFSQTATGLAQNEADSSSAVTAIYDGAGHFAASIENSVFWNQFPSQTAQSQVVFTNTITNVSGNTQNVNFDFNINSIKFVFASGFIGLSSTGIATNTASMAANILVNGVTAWSSAFSANPVGDYSAGSIYWTSSGTDIGLGSAAGSNCWSSYWECKFSISAYSQSLNLGALAPNDSLTVTYAVDLYTETTTYGGSSSVYFNDPADIAAGSTSPLSGSLHFAASSAAPEPETASLIAAGLGILGAIGTRRRRIKR